MKISDVPMAFSSCKCYNIYITYWNLKRRRYGIEKDYLEFILEQLCELEDISYRAMMGEYILYYRGQIVGGIYDDRLLVKDVESAIVYMPIAECELLIASFIMTKTWVVW